MDDQQMIHCYLQREETAIRETERKYGNYCRMIASNILHNTEDAEEAVNDAYMAAWNSIPPHVPEVFSSYLGRLVRNISLNKLRKRQAKKRASEETALVLDELLLWIPADQNVAEEVEAKEVAAAMNQFLMDLPSMQRDVFVCRYWYFDSIGSIAEQFRCSPNKVKSMLYRIRKKLFSHLEKEGLL